MTSAKNCWICKIVENFGGLGKESRTRNIHKNFWALMDRLSLWENRESNFSGPIEFIRKVNETFAVICSQMSDAPRLDQSKLHIWHSLSVSYFWKAVPRYRLQVMSSDAVTCSIVIDEGWLFEARARPKWRWALFPVLTQWTNTQWFRKWLWAVVAFIWIGYGHKNWTERSERWLQRRYCSESESHPNAGFLHSKKRSMLLAQLIRNGSGSFST